MKKSINLNDYIDEYLESDEQLQLQVKCYGYEKCLPNRKKSFRNEVFIYSLHYVISGKGYIQYENGAVQKIKSGEIFFLLPSSHSVTYYPDPLDPWTYVWIDFVGNNIPKILSFLSISLEKCHVRVYNKNLFEKLCMEMLYDCQQNKSYNNLICASYCYLLFAKLISIVHPTKSTNNSPASHIKKAQEYIEYHYSDASLDIDAVSKHCNLNKVYFSRLFKKETGLSFSTYLMGLRIHKASNLFRDGNFSVQSVAYAVGFSSPYYFSNTFKRYFTISPKEYILGVKEKIQLPKIPNIML